MAALNTEVALIVAEQRAHREHSARLMNTAIAVTDDVIRGEIEGWCEGHAGDDGYTWWDTEAPCGITDSEDDRREAARYIARAVRYIGLRSPDAFPWRFIRHPERPELVRFEDQP